MILSVISGTFQRLSYLKSMIESCRKSLPPNFIPGVDWEVVLADGGSTDGTLEWARSQSEIRLIEQGELLGAINAFNAAGAAARGNYLCVLNDDIEVVGYTIARGLAFMMDNPDVGAGCFYQNRAGKEWHVESMPIIDRDGQEKSLPYMQCGIIPRWLWDKCEGWGNWGGKTYGGDNYISARIYQSGYRVVAIEGCRIADKKADDSLRTKNESENNSPLVWKQFPEGITVPPGPIYENPLPAVKRVLYAPIIDLYDVAKEQKVGLREALQTMGTVWEVDYVRGKESVVDAAEAWQPHFVVTQFHTKDAVTLDQIKRIKSACQGPMINWSGDVWNDQATPGMLEILRHYEYHLTVNASLLKTYADIGIRSAYWQNSSEPSIFDNKETDGACDAIFIANPYTQARVDLATALKKLPHNVKVYGRNYPEGIAEGESLYNFRKTGKLYRGAKLAIADNQYRESRGFFSDRAFMAMAAGGCMLLHQRVDGMEELAGIKDGVHYVAWDTQEDLERKIAYYLEHEDERAWIAAAGTQECRENHSFAKRVEQLQGLIAKLPTKKRTLSVCMIVKAILNTRFDDLLASLRFADQIVIVNTGDEGGATEILLNRSKMDNENIKTYHFPWIDDFGAARNFAKSKCTGDYIMWIDLDERLSETAIRKLKNFSKWDFRKQGMVFPQAFKFNVVDYRDEVRGAVSYMQLRLFRNIESLKWSGKIHEHDFLQAKAKELGLSTVGFADMEIHHNTADLEAKAERDIRILKTLEPDAWRDSYLALSYASTERYADAILWFSQALMANLDDAHRDYITFQLGHALYRFGFVDQAKIRFKESGFLDAKFMLAEIEESEGRFNAYLYQEFLDGETPTAFPTHAMAWKAVALEKLRAWHQMEINRLCEPDFKTVSQ